MLIKIDETLDNFDKIFGCYVNAGKIISEMAVPVLEMSEEETKMYSKLLKKAISGKLGKNILSLRPNEAKDLKTLTVSKQARDLFFGKIADSLQTDKNYCVLFVQGSFDTEEESTPYFIASICPIKPSKSELKYNSDQEFREASTGSILASPIIGISYPSMITEVDEDHLAYYFSKDKHEELIEAFATDCESNDEIKSRLYASLAEAFEDDAVPAAAGIANALAAENSVTTGDICEALKDFPADRIDAFRSSFGEGTFKRDAVVDDTVSIEGIGTKATLNIEKFKTKTIDGKEYLLIPVEEIWKINGVEFK